VGIGRVVNGKTVLTQVVRHHARQAHIVFDHQELLHRWIIAFLQALDVSVV
jgi:hypothetical protein